MTGNNLLILQIIFILCNIIGVIVAVYAYEDDNIPKIFAIPIGYIVGLFVSSSISCLLLVVIIFGKALFL